MFNKALRLVCVGRRKWVVCRLRFGIVHYHLGDQATANNYLKEAYEIFLTALGPDHPDTTGLAPLIEYLDSAV